MTIQDNPLGLPAELCFWRFDPKAGIVFALSDGLPIAFVSATRIPLLTKKPDPTPQIGALIAAAPMMRDAMVNAARAMDPKSPGDEARSIHPWSPEAIAIYAVLKLLGVDL